ncbi:MAG: iron-containing alcohol dehydrogenase [Candidatus Izemoplasmataceae bacterium]
MNNLKFNLNAYYGPLHETFSVINHAKALIVIKKSLALKESNVLETVLEALNQENIQAIIYDEVDNYFDMSDLVKGAEIYHDFHCDFLLAIGATNTVDAAKMIALMASNQTFDLSVMHQETLVKTMPIMVIPTSLNLKASLSNTITLYDYQKESFTHFTHDLLMPDKLFIDQGIIKSLPFKRKLIQSMDNLLLAIESFNHPMPLMLESLAQAIIQKSLKAIPLLTSEEDSSLSILIDASVMTAMLASNTGLNIFQALERAMMNNHPKLPRGIISVCLAKAYYNERLKDPSYKNRYQKIYQHFMVDQNVTGDELIGKITQYIKAIDASDLIASMPLLEEEYTDYIHMASSLTNLEIDQDTLYALLENCTRK